ncbi:hypothetical protein [Domibacillus antri]|uniref:hypothetical protein n=1 Tax=Domibacillus antri TaxID=1714264 RepID=UPI000B22008D|nr:hypothetical protein [Domibacillus antri]
MRYILAACSAVMLLIGSILPQMPKAATDPYAASLSSITDSKQVLITEGSTKSIKII